MWGPSCLTVITLLILDDKLDLEGLLEKSLGVHFFLNGELYLDPS